MAPESPISNPVCMQILTLSVTAKLKMYVFFKSVPILNIDLFSNYLASFPSLFP